jgi:hypothetical protein
VRDFNGDGRLDIAAADVDGLSVLSAAAARHELSLVHHASWAVQ